ncbi:MAG: translation initiation factor IF-2 subunit beta [Candidatus Woesearchaeota archaeon]|nr:MAG: translation initiation factor IF-2 subunit beta [Candidatus Woesearchaeota archaeon]
MAWKYKYEDMLKRAYEKLPEKTKKETRFEIPKVDSEVQGNRTIVKFFPSLARKINRKPEHLMKFLLRELATTGKTPGKNAIFMGKFSRELMQHKFEKYLREFVLCDQCKKPDTALKKEKGLSFKICEACGAKSSVRSLKK